ncbi:MAG TPA: DUF5063 domain-containing protein [Candidatus Acidoferrales bacterium]|nr:DUF5063 domain-containing protein [Candidatus Acidoferrales bacterium]
MNNVDSFPEEELLRLSQEYCDLVGSQHLQIEDLLAKVAACLSQLYSFAVGLHYVEPATDQLPDLRIPKEESMAVWNALRRKLGAIESYWTIFDPRELGEPVQGSLANDLVEIYEDLRENIAFAKSNAQPADIQWSWRESFSEHWGNHAADALKAIYWRACR